MQLAAGSFGFSPIICFDHIEADNRQSGILGLFEGFPENVVVYAAKVSFEPCEDDFFFGMVHLCLDF